MLGKWISDPETQEAGGMMQGMGLLSVVTRLEGQKVRRQICGKVNKLEGIFSALSGLDYVGYEIHMGQTWISEDRQKEGEIRSAFLAGSNGMVYGTYVHGIFDKGDMAFALVKALAERKGISLESKKAEDYREIKSRQYEKLADTLRQYMDMEEIYGILGET